MGLTIDSLVEGVGQPPGEGLLLAAAYCLGILVINLFRQNYELDNSLLFV